MARSQIVAYKRLWSGNLIGRGTQMTRLPCNPSFPLPTDVRGTDRGKEISGDRFASLFGVKNCPNNGEKLSTTTSSLPWHGEAWPCVLVTIWQGLIKVKVLHARRFQHTTHELLLRCFVEGRGRICFLGWYLTCGGGRELNRNNFGNPALSWVSRVVRASLYCHWNQDKEEEKHNL